MKPFGYLVLLLLLFTCSKLSAQDFEFAALTNQDMQLKQNVLDSFSNAAVLNEFGEAHMAVDDASGYLKIYFYHHVRLKIFNKDGVKYANIVIPTFTEGNDGEYLSELHAMTLNGGNQQAEVLSKNIFEEKVNSHVTLHKFTFPDIKDGSIVEYSYRIESPRIFNFRTWEFQDDIPKVKSEFEAVIPANYDYNVSLRGPYQLTNQRSELQKEGIVMGGWRLDCSKLFYTMENIPAFVEEDYMTAAANFKSAIYFELAKYTTREGVERKFTQTWKDLDRYLQDQKNVCGQLKRTSAFKNILPSLYGNDTPEWTKADKIYRYVQKQIKWNKQNSFFTTDNIEDALSKHTGNAADINLSLATGLLSAGIAAEPILLSTRNNGTVNHLFPVISDFNYVIVRANINGQYYWLDATEPEMAFGQLPLRCINDSGRAISLKKESYWVKIDPVQKRSIYYEINGILDSTGKLDGNLHIKNTSYAAYLKRKELADYSTQDDYVEKLSKQLGGFTIGDYTIMGVDSVQNDVDENYAISQKIFDGTTFSQMYFNPFLLSRISKNPFNLNERTYPVDIGMPMTTLVTIRIQLPTNLKVATLPQNMNLILPGRRATYKAAFVVNGNELTCNYDLNYNAAVYSPDEYTDLKELISRVIQHQKTTVVLKQQ